MAAVELSALDATDADIEPCWGGPLAKADQIHRFPAKMTLGWAIYFFEDLVGSVAPNLDLDETRFHDPFAGSGTTMLVGLRHGCKVTGTELIRPSVRLAEAKCTPLGEKDLGRLREQLSENPLTYIRCAKQGTPDVDIWYPPAILRALQDLRDWSFDLREEPYFPHLYSAISQTCWDVSSADQGIMVPTHSKRSPDNSKLAPGDVRRVFQERLERVIQGQEALRELGIQKSPEALFEGSCLDTTNWPATCDLVLTSPPYGLGINYVRAASLQWRVLEPETYAGQAHQKMLGRRNNLEFDLESLPDGLADQPWYAAAKEETPKRHAGFCQYLVDLGDFFATAKEQLSPDGLMGVVIGNPEMVGHRVPLVAIARALALDAGLEEAASPVRDEIRRRFQTSQRRSSNEPISHEYLLTFRR